MEQKKQTIPQKVLVLAEHDNQTLKQATYPTLGAARLLAEEITVAVIGYDCETVAHQAAKLEGVKKVLCCNAQHYQYPLAEEVAQILESIARDYQAILAPATTFGKNCLPRLAALLDVSQISDVIQILSPDTFLRPLYAGNVLATVQSLDPIKILTIRPTAFQSVSEKIEEVEGTEKREGTEGTEKIEKVEGTEKIAKTEAAIIEPLNPLAKLELSQFIKREQAQSTRPELSQASIVVAGGRGLQSRENVKLLEELADTLGAAIGASRAAVDAGFLPNDLQVGQTGKVIAPQLYIAVGISGAIQHLAGMKDSKVIVAINKDPEAPIFQVADYGILGDLCQILPELKQEITIRKQSSAIK